MSIREIYHKAIKLKFLDGVKMEVTFEDGLTKRFDMSELYEQFPEYKALEDRSLFESGQLLSFVIVWTDLLDIETEDIYESGTIVRKAAPSAGTNAGSAVAFTRLTRNLSQAALARRSGMDQSDISKIERGIANPSMKTLLKIADALDCKLVIKFEPKDPYDPDFCPHIDDNDIVIRT